MKYTKMQACKNDYSYINCFEEQVRDPRKLALKLAESGDGIGSDGLILVEPSRRADAFMRVFNRKGKPGKMFGNGVICVVKYIYENQIIPKHRRRARIDTEIGLRDTTFEVADGSVTSVTVDMGCATLKGPSIAIIRGTDETIDYERVDMGSSHAVVFLGGEQELSIEKAAETIENSATFLGGVAVETVKVKNPNEIEMFAWETGDGETPACATGAAAAVAVGYKKGKLQLPVLVHLVGGDLTINIDPDSEHIFITGSAENVTEGEIDI